MCRNAVDRFEGTDAKGVKETYTIISTRMAIARALEKFVRKLKMQYG
jgi:hypothetical protein